MWEATQYAPPLYAACCSLAPPIHALCLRCPARLAPWIFMIDRQQLALGGGIDYGVIHINYVVAWKLTKVAWWPWPFDLESGVCANFSLPRPLCSRVKPDVCNRQTDRRQTDRSQIKVSLNAPAYKGRGHNNIRELNWQKISSTHRYILLRVKLNNKSKIRLWTFSNANSAKCHLRSRARSRDL